MKNQAITEAIEKITKHVEYISKIVGWIAASLRNFPRNEV